MAKQETLKDIMYRAHQILKNHNITISCAESCTGGNIGRTLITYSGASDFFEGGIVAYTDEIKNRILKIPQGLLDTYTAVSPQVAKEMAYNVRKMYYTDYGISSTGYADPSSEEAGKIFVGVSTPQDNYFLELNSKFKTREEYINNTTHQAITFLEDILKKETSR